ncbi:MAG: response regulator [Candidatus Sericytochromatia bacterium]
MSEKFTQENLTITRRYGGSGLGLSIIKKLIERMGSRIEVESKIGVGSKFFFYLELENSNKVLDVSYQPEKINSFNPHILIVEDNKVNVMVATKFLDKWNMTYEVAENGLIATQKFQKNKFDLILMDLQMPEMDGYTATQEIRKLDKTIPIIALTANTVSEEREKCLNSGFNEYITKPFKSENLHDKIRFFTNDKNIS